MIIDDGDAERIGRQLLELSEIETGMDAALCNAPVCISLGKIAFKLVAPKVLEMIREPTPAMLEAAETEVGSKPMDNVVWAWRVMIDKMREDYGG